MKKINLIELKQIIRNIIREGTWDEIQVPQANIPTVLPSKQANIPTVLPSKPKSQLPSLDSIFNNYTKWSGSQIDVYSIKKDGDDFKFDIFLKILKERKVINTEEFLNISLSLGSTDLNPTKTFLSMQKTLEEFEEKFFNNEKTEISKEIKEKTLYFFSLIEEITSKSLPEYNQQVKDDFLEIFNKENHKNLNLFIEVLDFLSDFYNKIFIELDSSIIQIIDDFFKQDLSKIKENILEMSGIDLKKNGIENDLLKKIFFIFKNKFNEYINIKRIKKFFDVLKKFLIDNEEKIKFISMNLNQNLRKNLLYFFHDFFDEHNYDREFKSKVFYGIQFLYNKIHFFENLKEDLEKILARVRIIEKINILSQIKDHLIRKKINNIIMKEYYLRIKLLKN